MHTTLLLSLAFGLGATEATPSIADTPPPTSPAVAEAPDGAATESPVSGTTKETPEAKTGPGSEERWFDDPNRTRYLYAPSAMMLRPGECYYSQKELLFSAVGCGLLRNVTVLGGTVVPAWFLVPVNGWGMNALAALKMGTGVGELFHVAGGFETILVPLPDGLYSAGFVFASATAGNRNAHATISVGKPFLFAGDNPGTLGELIVVLAANYRVSPNVALVTENWIMPNWSSHELVMVNGLAFRLFDHEWAMDMGLVRVPPGAALVPWLDFSYHFG